MFRNFCSGCSGKLSRQLLFKSFKHWRGRRIREERIVFSQCSSHSLLLDSIRKSARNPLMGAFKTSFENFSTGHHALSENSLTHFIHCLHHSSHSTFSTSINFLQKSWSNCLSEV